MDIGIPKEIKVHEYRVGATPYSVREFVARGHRVLVEHDAGAAIGFGDEDYRAAGAEVVAQARLLMASGCSAIAYETATSLIGASNGRLPPAPVTVS